MVSGPEDDFSSFLEFSDLQLDYPSFDGNHQNGQEFQDGGTAGTAIEMQTSNDPSGVIDFQHGSMQQFANPSGLGEFESSLNIFPDLDMPSQLFDQQQQQQQQPQIPQSVAYGQPYRGHNMIPHTPNSIEMHGGQLQYHPAASNNHARTMYEQYRHQPKGQVGHTLCAFQQSLQ